MAAREGTATAGLVGFGGIGRVHADALARIGVPLAGVVGSSPASTARAAQALGARGFASASELIASPDVDVVHVCTPNHLHVPLAREALRAGKHVVCEKPLAPDHAAAAALAQEADAAGVVHAVCHHQRFAAGIPELRAAVARGELGELHLVSGAFQIDDFGAEVDAARWHLDPARIGRSLTLADIGVHWWDLLEHVTGERIVSGVATTRSLRAGGLDDSAAILLRLTGGAHATATLSQVAPGPGQRISLELVGTTTGAVWQGAETSGTEEAARFKQDAFEALFRAIYADVAAGTPAARPAYPTFHDGARAVAVLDALLDSLGAGRWCEVSAPTSLATPR